MMNKILKFWKSNKDKKNIKAVTEKQLSKNMDVIKSLRDYDEGKKDISTNNIRRYLPDIRVASK